MTEKAMPPGARDDRAGGARQREEASGGGDAHRDPRIDELVATLTAARPVFDDLTRARVAARIESANRRMALGSAVSSPVHTARLDDDQPAPGPARHHRLRGRWLYAIIAAAVAVLVLVGLVVRAAWCARATTGATTKIERTPGP